MLNPSLPIHTDHPRSDAAPPTRVPGRTLICPRCDYDLSGLIPVDHQASPGGVCPECGLAVQWSELLRPLPAPAWALEPKPPETLTGWVVRPLRVVRRTLAPASLWHGPSEEIPDDPARIKLMLAHPILPRRVLGSGAVSVAAAWLFSFAVLCALAALSYGLLTLRHHAYVAYQVAGTTTTPLGAPRIFPQATLSEFLGRYATTILVPGVPWTAPSADTQRILVMTVWAMGTAALMPLCFLLLGQTMARLRVRRRHLWRLAAYGLPPIPMIGLAFSVLTWAAALLETLRVWLSNARTAAELRVEGYEWAHPVDGWVKLTSSADSWLYVIQRWLRREGSVVLAVGVLCFVWLFWYRASSRYLRLPRAWLDTFLLLLVAVLGVPTIVLIVSQGVRAFTGAWP